MAKGASSDSESSRSGSDLERSIPLQHSTPTKSSPLSQKSPVAKTPRPNTTSSDSSSTEEERGPKSPVKKVGKAPEGQLLRNGRTASSSSDSSSSEEESTTKAAGDTSKVAKATKVPARQSSSASSSDSSSDEEEEEDVSKGSKATIPKHGAQAKQGLKETQLKEQKKLKNDRNAPGGATNSKSSAKVNSGSPTKASGVTGEKSPAKSPSNGVKAKGGAAVDSSDSSDSDSDAESETTPSAPSTPLSEFHLYPPVSYVCRSTGFYCTYINRHSGWETAPITPPMAGPKFCNRSYCILPLKASCLSFAENIFIC